MYHLLREKLFASKKAYRGMILRHVIENLNGIHVENTTPVYLIGFSGLNKTDEVIISHLIATTNAEVIWDADNYYVRDEMKEAGLF